MAMDQVQTGAEVFLEDVPDYVEGKNVGFITNHTGVTRDLRSLVNVFLERGIRLKALFGPEHGIRGEVADGVNIESGVDRRTGVPVHSLYGAGNRKPTPEMLKGLDLLIIDIQDVGVRFYTFLWTMAHCLEAAAEVGVPLVVLDRPNPINGQVVEGPVLDPKFSSFVGLYPVTTRTGMTTGEVARFVASHLEQGFAALRVIPMRGWKRSMWYDNTGLQFIAPSPNMPSLDTATVYPGTCLIEGTNLSEGRGTAQPFEMLGAPWLDAIDVAEAANELKIPGVLFRPTYFTPAFSKHQGKACQAIQVHVVDRNQFEAVKTGLELVILIRKMYPDSFEFRTPGASGQHYFDLLIGTDKPRLMIEEGASAQEIVDSWEPGLREYLGERSKLLLYA